MGWCTVWWSRSLFKIVMLGQFLWVPWNLDIFHDRLGPGRWNWEITLRPEIWWHDAVYHHCMKWTHSANANIYWSWPAGGAVVLWTSCCNIILAATKQLYEWFSPSVCLSVTPFSLCSLHHIIMKFSGIITTDKSEVHAKGQGHRALNPI